MWALRIAWVLLPLLAGPAFAGALDGRDPAFRLVVLVGLWGLWTLTVAATLAPHPVTLTWVRVIAPATLASGGWAFAADPGWLAVGGIVWPVVCVVAAFLPPVGAAFADGVSYGAEQRFPLRPPAPLLFGPIPLAWAVTVGGALAGPMLLAAQGWIAGAVVTVVGLPLAAAAVRSLHVLSRRWLIFVPNGLVTADPLVLADPVLFRRGTVSYLGPAPVDTGATDLTAQAAGRIVEIRMREPAAVVRRGETEAEPVLAVLVAPTLDRDVVAEADRRQLVR